MIVKSTLTVLFSCILALPLMAQDFPADAENGYKDLQLGATVSEVQKKLSLSKTDIRSFRADVVTYRVEQKDYLERDDFSFDELQTEAAKEKIIRLLWIKNNTDTTAFNKLLTSISNKYGDVQRTMYRGTQTVKEWFFERVVIELFLTRFPDGKANIRLSWSLRRNLQ